MAQLVSILFFSVALTGAFALIAGMLRSEWTRLSVVLSGEALGRARAIADAQARVRVRAWNQAEARRALPQLRAAA
ncbi:MAG: hypothetical protein JSS55_08465 [Proteobacteria bacterium]|nr:hypothetical protein [Pseudomonadota bacterium]